MIRLLLLLALALPGCERGDPPLAHDPAREVPAGEVAGVYAALEGADAGAIESALARVLDRGDRRFIAVLIESLRFSHLAEAESQAYNARVVALERLAGQPLGGDWFRWAEWYEGTRLVPPPGFLGYKGRLFARIQPELGAFLARADGAEQVRLRPELIRWGGVEPGGIPALTNPALVSAGKATWLEPGETVLGLVHAGEARAYPARILDWHELVNDRFDGEPVSLAACTLCGSAIAYRTGRKLGAGAAAGASHTFETSGLLYRGNKLMFDHATRSLWSQLEGRAVLGPLAEDGLALEPLPVVVTTWEAWREQHPDTTVIALDTGHERDYEPGAPYGGYLASAKLLFPSGVRDERLEPKARVYGVTREGHSRAWPLEDLARRGVVNDSLGRERVVLVATRGLVEVEARVPRTGRVRYVSGAEVRAYRRGGARFAATDESSVLRDGGGRPWRVAEDALVGPAGERAERLPGTLAYWFAWRAFHPETGVWEGSEP